MKIIKKYYWRLKDKYLDFYNILFYKNYKFEKTYFLKSDLQKNLNKYLEKNKNTILEIGSYEGLASIWFARKYLKFKTSTLDIVDPFFLDDSTTAMSKNTLSNFLHNLGTVEPLHKANLSYPGCWAYPDMLQVGCKHGPGGAADPGLSPEETRSHFGSWAIVSSPLTLSHDVWNTTISDEIWDVIANTEVLEVNQAYVGDSG